MPEVSFWWAEERRKERKGAHGDDIFVAVAESLESAEWYRVHSSGPLLITSLLFFPRARTEEENRRTKKTVGGTHLSL
jgi:hypothetical protein